MSGFLKRNTTKTVNPAGGVNPASSPNVSQYGWTSYDAGNVNQIIEYVNICKQYAQSAKDSADYVQSKFDELADFLRYIEKIYEQIGPIFDNIELLYEDIVQKHTEVKYWHSEVLSARDVAVTASIDANDSKVQSQAAMQAAKTSKDAAKVSEDNAAASAKDAADIAEELRKGQVYRGTWNIEANNSYPPKPDTNSVWDVVLNEDSIEFNFDGQKWFWGDRILYLKDDDAFSQIESGSTVISVNGKSGAVQLNASDVGALGSSGGVLTGHLYFDNNADVTFKGSGTNNPIIWFQDKDDGNRNKIAIYHDRSTDSVTVNHYNSTDGKYARFRFKQGDVSPTYTPDATGTAYRIYHEGFKPSAADVGALPITGGTVTGQTIVNHSAGLQVRDGDYGIRMINSGSTLYHQAGKMDRNVDDQKLAVTGWYGTPLSFFRVAMAEGKYAYIQQGGTDYRIYHQGYKPTASDVGALPISGGTLTGPLTVAGMKSAIKVNDQRSISYQDQAGVVFHNLAYNNALQWSHGNNAENTIMSLDSEGSLNTTGYQFARNGHISRSSDDTRWLGIESPDGVDPFISFRAGIMTAPDKTLTFNGHEIVGHQRFAAGQYRVADNGGLKFSPYADLAGVSWGVGMDPSDGVLAFHKYQEGAWASAPLQLANDHTVHTNTLFTTGAHQVRNSSNPLTEWIIPGAHARMLWLDTNNADFNVATSNGSFGEVSRMSKWDAQGRFMTYHGLHVNYHPNNPWGGYDKCGVSPLQDTLYVDHGQWVPMIVSPSIIENSWRYSCRISLGHYRDTIGDGGPSNGSFVINMVGDGYLGNNQRFHFNSIGNLSAYGTYNYAGMAWEASHWGFWCGRVGNIIDWSMASFVPLSDENKKEKFAAPTKSALDDVRQIKFQSYQWKDSGKSVGIGFTAQQLEIIDENYAKDILVDSHSGDDDTKDPEYVKAIDTTNLLALALKAIQELEARVAELEEKLNV